MKRTLLILGIAALLAVSCSTSVENEKIDFATVTAEKTFKLDEKSANSPQSEIKLSVLYVKGEGQKAKLMNDTISQWLFNIKGVTMQQVVDSFVNMRGKNYVADFKKLYKADKASNATPGGWYQAHYDLKTRTEQDADTIINYVAEQDTYDGGAHGLFIKSVMNFSTKTGKQVTLDNVLLPGYKTRLNEILLEKLLKQTHSKDIDELRRKGYLYSMDMCPSQFYLINSKGITFIYNQYEIAPYAVGITELKLTWDELKDVAKTPKD